MVSKCMTFIAMELLKRLSISLSPLRSPMTQASRMFGVNWHAEAKPGLVPTFRSRTHCQLAPSLAKAGITSFEKFETVSVSKDAAKAREAGEFMVEVFIRYQVILEMMRRVVCTAHTQHQGAEDQENSKQFSEEEIHQLQTLPYFCAKASMKEKTSTDMLLYLLLLLLELLLLLLWLLL